MTYAYKMHCHSENYKGVRYGERDKDRDKERKEKGKGKNRRKTKSNLMI